LNLECDTSVSSLRFFFKCNYSYRYDEVVAPGACLDLAAGDRWLRR
jgi:hypothetical protein